MYETSVRNLIRPLVTRQGGSAMAYYRRTGPLDVEGAGPAPAAAPAEPMDVTGDPAPTERDALDRLFLGGD